MTQPPQPPQPPQQPNEPRKEGFGAPQSPPPAGGFGAPPPPAPGTPPPPAPGAPPLAQPPGPPPGQPAYGYPQGPGTPPPPAPGTPPPGQPGQPGQQGYGYPAPGQPQYGYQQYPPQHVTQPMGGPGGPGGGKKFNSQMAIIVAAVVAVALIVGGGVWYSSSGDDPKEEAKAGTTGGKGGDSGPAGGGGDEKVPSNTASQVRFQLPAPKVGADTTLSVKGSWLTDDAYVKSGDSKIVGYEPKTGKELWTLPLSGPTCAGSRQVSDDGLAAVVFEAQGKKQYNGCSQIAVFDTNTGDKLWQKEVSDGGDKADFQEVVISGETVAVGGGTDGGAAFELKSGKPRWAPKPSDTCKDAGYAGGEQLVAVRECGSYDNPRVEVQLIDQVSGTPKWTYKLPAGIDNAKVMSTKPVVFGVDSGDITDTGVTDIFALDEAGKLRSKAALGQREYQFDCDVNMVQECSGVAVGNDRVYVPTAQHQGSGDYGMTNEIVAFDLATGKTVGPKADAGEKYQMLPLRMDGTNILAYKVPPYDKGGQVVTIDPKTGKQTLLLENPAQEDIRDAETQFVLPDGAEMLYGDGALYISDKLMSKPSASDTRKRNLAIVFGAN